MKVKTIAGALPLGVLWGLPLMAALVLGVVRGVDADAWRALFEHPQLWPALWLSLFTGIAATGLSLLCTLIILAGLYRTRLWNALQPMAAAGLALPHLAFAIGFAFLVAPSGLLARLAVGGTQPPQWSTIQDPWGLALIAALVLKEIPFLLVTGWSALSRGDQAAHLDGQCRAAASLGHGTGSAWLRIVQPQLLSHLRWPLVIVFVYGSTVVDKALVLGPTQPPTLSLVIWNDLNDAETATNLRGLAGAFFMSLALGLMLAASGLMKTFMARLARPLLSAGPSLASAPKRVAAILGGGVVLLSGVVTLLLAVLSVSPRWPYPAIWPPVTGTKAWLSLFATPAPLWTSLALAATTAVVAVLVAIIWFETQDPSRDRYLLVPALFSLAIPQLVIGGGQYGLFLTLGLVGTPTGLFIAHFTPVMAYVAIVLAGPWRGFDNRYMAAARALSSTPLRNVLRIKLPMLKAPLLTAAAVGFGVSMVQFVPAQLAAAGRYSTLPMEAVTLTSGGNRSLTAAYALALAIPPLIVFLAAGLLGRPRWR